MPILTWKGWLVVILVGGASATAVFACWLLLATLYRDHLQLQQVVTLIQSGQIPLRTAGPGPAGQPPAPSQAPAGQAPAGK